MGKYRSDPVLLYIVGQETAVHSNITARFMANKLHDKRFIEGHF